NRKGEAKQIEEDEEVKAKRSEEEEEVIEQLAMKGE
ncbi:hypothetical protein A2U01_0040091, partial [Trifolium medium]|nr:hypothetical protein [Trifolium medium]